MLAPRTFATLALFVSSGLGATYSQSDSYQGSGFLQGLSHQAIPCPSNGRVNYIDQGTALAQNLTYASGDHFVIRADHTTALSANGLGRNSVRLQSNKQYKTHVAVFNVRHMYIWPALWEVGADWPNQGEIDIVEGVNDRTPNQATLHTNVDCTMSASRSQTG
ncbi:hypothetical protein BD413DRAFT_287320 [Trametes elegans]|nr:hypothetical protein BD413DRAFT_287320 [Trametes elegans]